MLQRKTLEAKLEEGQVFVEFEQIPRKAAKHDCSIAAAPENRDRNRFKDVHPYDHNRVKLTATKDNPLGYINASHVKVGDCGQGMASCHHLLIHASWPLQRLARPLEKVGVYTSKERFTSWRASGLKEI